MRVLVGLVFFLKVSGELLVTASSQKWVSLSQCPGPVDVWLKPGLMGRSLVRSGKVCVRQVQQLNL